MSLSLRTLPALALALVLSACGGGSVEPVTQKGFGPSQLYDPARNPTGRVLQEGDTGIVMLGGSGPQQVWFEIGEAATYGVELEDEDLATLARVEVANASGQTLAWADAAQRTASADLAPGRYVMRLAPAATAPAEGTALFLHFDADEAEAGAKAGTAKTAEAGRKSLQIGACMGCDLRGAILLGADLRKADLRKADLRDANLHGANLAGANAAGADFRRAKLQAANLSGTNLASADLAGAYLFGANLAGADLSGVDLVKVNLTGVDLRGATLPDGRICAAVPPLDLCM
ncbi:Pentapeptide repeat-containing protein [Paenacidovorax caeni]|uniref:Pentapeptide repeat-containing protein n=1 Tax=Paenacidovorax caeni TaxID=343013 RepID=A0A1I7JGC5_9BURK|nr:pentapeptide repeat-containing protein [Paenacidovorax caeni]SFU84192.1 Pentapeptide repeat-containing protein [Paenacidovorax caeni]